MKLLFDVLKFNFYVFIIIIIIILFLILDILILHISNIIYLFSNVYL